MIFFGSDLAEGGVREEAMERQEVGVRERVRIPSRVMVSVYVSHVHVVVSISSSPPLARGIAMGILVEEGESGTDEVGSGGGGEEGRDCWKTRMMTEVSSMKALRLGSFLTTSEVFLSRRAISSNWSSRSPVAMAVGSLVVSSCIRSIKEV